LGPYNQLPDIIRINKVDEIIFSAKVISSEEIIQNMMKLSRLNIDFKIAHPEGLSIIGSNCGFIVNIFYVISGRKSWIGYDLQADSKSMEQDSVQQGVLTPASLYPRSTGQERKRINLSYAKDYRLSKDIEIILKKWKQLGE